MNLLRLAASTATLALEELRATVRLRRYITAAVAYGIIVVVAGASFARSAALSWGVANPVALWQHGAAGALAALAYGILPLAVPLIPVVLGYDFRRRALASGYMETVMSRPIPRWLPPLARFLGAFLAASLALLLPLLIAVVMTQSVYAPPGPTTEFVGAVLLGTVLLGALYLALALFLGSVLKEFVAPIAFLVWLGSNAIRTTAFLVGGQFLLIVPLRDPQSFRTAWTDWLSFTGLYQAFLAWYVPDSLLFLIRPQWPDLWNVLAYLSVPAGLFLWIGALLALFVVRSLRLPLRR